MAGDRGLAFVVCGMIGLSALWIASGHPTAPLRAERVSSSAEAGFLVKTAQRTLFEMLLGELAEQKGSGSVRRLAVTISADYRRVNSELQHLASTKGVIVPGEIDSESRADYEYLASLPADAFDRNYTTFALRDHHVAAEDLEQEAAAGDFPDLKRFASDNLPRLRQRLRLIEDTAARVGATAPER